jgi:hypothetical protein
VGLLIAENWRRNLSKSAIFVPLRTLWTGLRDPETSVDADRAFVLQSRSSYVRASRERRFLP